MTPIPDAASSPTPEPASVATVEELVRRQLSAAFGGLRGVVESAVPSITFLVAWLTTEQLRRSIVIAVAVAVGFTVTSFTDEDDIEDATPLDDVEDEEERLIMQGGAGIPIGPVSCS